MAEARGAISNHAMLFAELWAVLSLSAPEPACSSPWNECAFERVAREVDDGGRTI